MQLIRIMSTTQPTSTNLATLLFIPTSIMMPITPTLTSRIHLAILRIRMATSKTTALLRQTCTTTSQTQGPSCKPIIATDPILKLPPPHWKSAYKAHSHHAKRH